MLDLPGLPLQPPRPDLPGTVVFRETADDALDAVAADLFIQSKNCVRAFGDFHLAVSVTDQTEALLRRLMYDPSLRDLPWKRTHLWITDERAADPDEDASRFGVLRQLVIDHSDIPVEQTHPMQTQAGQPDRHYEALLREHLGWREKGHDRLDYILLSLGDQGSIAGLYPGMASAETGRLAKLNPAAAEDQSVLTLTIEMLNAARFIAVLAMGPGRRAAIVQVISGKRRQPASPASTPLPAAQLAPLAGELRWYVDRDAVPA